jgi:hypothetical protein
MLAPSFFTLVHMSISSTASTSTCNFNLSLEIYTYNLIVEARASNNNQYPRQCLTTHVITKGESASQIALAITQVCAKGILFTKTFIWCP